MSKAVSPNVYLEGGLYRFKARLPGGIKVNRPFLRLAAAEGYRDLVLGSPDAQMQQRGATGFTLRTDRRRQRPPAQNSGRRWARRAVDGRSERLLPPPLPQAA